MPVTRVFCSERPTVSVIVPSADGSREGNLPRLVDQLERQKQISLEILVVIGESPNGYARNLGAREATGEYLVFIDDDVGIDDELLLKKMIEPFEAEEMVGLTGVSQRIPPGAGKFQRRCADQLPRVTSPVVDRLTDSDMVTTMCLAIPRELFLRIGQMNDRMISGVDPELRHRVRSAGYRVVIVPKAWAYHPLPEGPLDLATYAFKKGSFSAWQFRFARELSFDCPEGHVFEFDSGNGLPYRVGRKVLRMIKEVGGIRFIGFVYDCSYIGGYLAGLVKRWR